MDVKQHWNIASELRSCVKVEVAVLGSPSVIVLMVSVDVKQHWNITSEQCGSRGGRPDTATVLYGLQGRRATLRSEHCNIASELCESRGGRPDIGRFRRGC